MRFDATRDDLTFNVTRDGGRERAMFHVKLKALQSTDSALIGINFSVYAYMFSVEIVVVKC